MVLAVIIPIFLFLALGYLSVKLKILTKDQTATIGAFVIKIALPALLLQSLASKDLHEIWLPEYFVVYTVATFLLYGCGFLLAYRHFKSGFSESAVLALGSAMSNTGLIGAAVLTLVMGHKAMTYISLVVIIESVLLIPTVLVLAKLGTQKMANVHGIVKDTFATLLKNPLFMSVVLGVALATFEIKIPHHLDQVLSMLGHTSSPLALFSIGGGIVGLTLKYVNVQSWYLVISSNLLMPLLVFLGLNYLTHVPKEMVYAGTLIAALPMPTIFGMLGQAYGLSDKTLTPLLMSTIVGFIGTSLLIMLWWG